MLNSLSMTTVPDPLSAGLIPMSARLVNCVRAVCYVAFYIVNVESQVLGLGGVVVSSC